MPSKTIDVEKLNTLIEINTLISSSYSDVNALLVYILESAMRLVECESSSLLLLHEGEDDLRFEVALGPKGVECLGIPVSREGSIAGWVVKNNKSLIIDDAVTDERFYSAVQDKTGYVTKTMIAVPMRVHNKCVGVIELLNKKGNQRFTHSDLEIIELLSNQASIAYQNADTYQRARNEIRVLQNKITAGSEYHTFIAESSKVKDLVEVIDKVAITNSSVLILGESGVGKELFAEQIHLKSLRNKKPFVRVNCAALSPTLLESELFGHVKGAFTDAHSDRKGRFEMANGGTLFLDEIGELPLDLQVKLLRVIQSRSFEKVGSSETLTVDVRIIAATNRDIEQMVAEGKFRSDLYYRLNVLPLYVPPLRQRKEDIMPLAMYFCSKFSAETKKDFIGFTQDTIDTLHTYFWPGNVRELENSIERSCVLGKPPLITAKDLRLNVKNDNEMEEELMDGDDKTLKAALFRFKKAYVTKVLADANWNQTEAGKVLGIQRTYVSRLMNELEIR
ncbi:MAG: sigma 54-interacting transcriptional regulator [Treponema sp.]|nr:sigma 54-interacting transcriptional regulator [Treponema sp.]